MYTEKKTDSKVFLILDSDAEIYSHVVAFANDAELRH